MKNGIAFLKKHYIEMIFILFFIAVLIEHHFLWLYHDDYGYASLSYAYVIDGINGLDYGLKELFTFCLGHYKVWGGRVLYFFIESFLLKFGLSPFRIVQSVIITLIFYFIYKIITKMTGIKDIKVAIMTIACYGLFEIMVVRSGIFWITASVLYVFPILPFLAFVYFYTLKKDRSLIKTILCGILIFLATFSQEQTAALALGFIILYSFWNFIKMKKINWQDIIMVIIGFIGFGILMLAPGNKIRMQHPTSASFYELNIIEKIGRNLKEIIINNFGEYTRFFTIIFILAIIYLCYLCIKKNYGKKILNKIALLSNCIILFFTIFHKAGYFSLIQSILPSGYFYLFIFYLLSLIQLSLMIYIILLYLFKNEKLELIWMILGAIASQAVMLMAPYFPSRSVIVFDFCMFLFILYVFTIFISNIDNNKLIYLLMIPICFLSFYNFIGITKGYYSNNEINKNNHLTLKSVSEDIKNGKNIKEVHLSKLNDITYSGDQPYIEGCDYITVWMKQYYDLPSDINIIYD